MAKIGFIGMGNMGSTTLNGLPKVRQPGDMVFTAAYREKMEKVIAEVKVKHALSNREYAGQVGYLILAMKPQYSDIVFEGIRGAVGPEQVIISLAPGISIGNIRTRLGDGVRVVRAISSTPAMLDEEMTGVTYEAAAYDKERRREIELIFSSYGRMEPVEERLMDTMGCVSGSSPTFVYVFIGALVNSGVEYGLPRKTAYAIATQTMTGSAKMVLGTGRHPGQLKGEMRLPEGIIIAGISALEEHGFRNSMTQAANARYNKTRRMKQDLKQYEQIKIKKGLREMGRKAENREMPVVRPGKELEYEDNILKVYGGTVLVNGHKTKWDFIHHDGAVAVLLITDDKEILMVRQYRSMLNHFILEAPAGKLDAPDEPKVGCAFRELEEETGFGAESKEKLEYLMNLTTTVTFCNEAVNIFMAHNLIPPRQYLDEDKMINTIPRGLMELEEMTYTGEITDGRTIAAVMAYAGRYRPVDKKDGMV